jgi:F-type H+-transporting ATPase subunit alpha
LKQPQFEPLPFEKQVLIVFAGTGGFLDDMPVENLQRFEAELYRFTENAHAGVLNEIREKRALDDSLKGRMKDLVKEFKERFTSETKA